MQPVQHKDCCSAKADDNLLGLNNDKVLSANS